MLADPDARVSAHVALRLWEVLPKLTQRESFGLCLSELVGAAPLTAAAWFVLSSATLGEGLERAVRFQRLLHDHAASELTHSEQGVTYLHRIGDASFRAPRHAIEFGFAQLVHLMRRASGQPVSPAWVEFQHAPPPECGQHRRLFGQEIRFNASSDRLHFDCSTCELSSLQADPALGELVGGARSGVARTLAGGSQHRRPGSARAGCRAARKLLAIDAVAASLSLSKRTLQRRLRDEGTSFDEILDELRRHLSERYLAEQQLSVQETAFLLGYSDVSAFHGAFSRWTGRSPARFRLDS